MGTFVNNVQIKCTACGYNPVRGKETSTKRNDGSIYEECQWVCPRCNRLVRHDDRIIPVVKRKE